VLVVKSVRKLVDDDPTHSPEVPALQVGLGGIDFNATHLGHIHAHPLQPLSSSEWVKSAGFS